MHNGLLRINYPKDDVKGLAKCDRQELSLVVPHAPPQPTKKAACESTSPTNVPPSSPAPSAFARTAENVTYQCWTRSNKLSNNHTCFGGFYLSSCRART